MDSTGNGTPGGRLVASLLAGLSVHAIAVAISFAFSALHTDGCDTSDGLAAALFLAAAADLILAAVTVLITARSNRTHYRAVLLGWTLSFIPAITAFCAALTHANSLASGC